MPERRRTIALISITGSPAGVYEPLSWIAPLFEFIRESQRREDDRRLLRPSGDGAGARRHRHQVGERLGRGAAPLLGDARSAVDRRDRRRSSIPASHQDQVVVQPPNTDVVAASPFTPFAALAWSDRPAICFQFHPEFTPAFAKALIEKRYDRVQRTRRGDRLARCAQRQCARRRAGCAGSSTGEARMKTRAAVAFEAKKPLEIVEVDLEGPKAGRSAGRDHGDGHLPHRRLHARRVRQRRASSLRSSAMRARAWCARSGRA